MMRFELKLTPAEREVLLKTIIKAREIAKGEGEQDFTLGEQVDLNTVFKKLSLLGVKNG